MKEISCFSLHTTRSHTLSHLLTYLLATNEINLLKESRAFEEVAVLRRWWWNKKKQNKL